MAAFSLEKNEVFKEYKLFTYTGLVVSVMDGIVSFIGASAVAYMKL